MITARKRTQCGNGFCLVCFPVHLQDKNPHGARTKREINDLFLQTIAIIQVPQFTIATIFSAEGFQFFHAYFD